MEFLIIIGNGRIPPQSPYGDSSITRLTAQTALIQRPPDSRALSGEPRIKPYTIQVF